MGRAAFATRVGFGWLAMFAALGALSCEQFDPVKSDNLCERDDSHAISMLCPQCSTPPFAWRCSECFKMLTPDPERCEPRDPPSPATDPDGGGSGAGGSSGGEAGEGGQGGEAGEGGEGGESGAGGAGGSGAGSGGMSGGPTSGAGGEPMTDPFTCKDEFWCMTNEPTLPGCLEGRCVECTRNEHCKGDQPICNVMLNRCENCVEDDHCESGACNEMLRVCVECERNEDCQNKDPVKDACDTTRFVCVDCVGAAGCGDPAGIKTTCHSSAQVCVDCLDDPDCGSDKPACDKQTRECVECTNDTHCRDSVKGSCDTTTRTCVDCVNNAGCAGTSKPQCDPEANVCVECLEDGHCASGHCLEQVCVQCRVDEDCPSATASHCDSNSHTCVGCTSNAHCEHLEDTQACNNRRCVECNDDTTCGGFSCIRAQHVCSDVRTNSLATCSECQADSMCRTGMSCAPLSFDGRPYGTYCVYLRQGGSCTNRRPYSQPIANVRSVDGVMSSFCIPPSSTTCPGIIDATRVLGGVNCTSASDCGVDGMADAQCAEERGCTYGCADLADCASPMTCLANLTCG